MKWLLNLFTTPNSDSGVISASRKTQIKEAAKRREKEIDSLKAYDQGKKEIHAPNLREIVRSVR